jgi:NADH-quinone oxidoreductase subunit L
VLSLLALVGGIINLPGSNWLNHYLAPVIAKPAEHHALDGSAYMLMGLAVAGALIGIGIAYYKYIKQSAVPGLDSEITGFAKVLYNKFYVDEIYTAIIVNPIYAIGSFFRDVTEAAFSGFIFGLGKVANILGSEGKTLQNGSVGFYLFAFVLGICSIIVFIFLAK